MMKLDTLDPITLNDVVDLKNAPFVIEGKGEKAIKLYFESEVNRSIYLDIPAQSMDMTDRGALNQVFN